MGGRESAYRILSLLARFAAWLAITFLLFGGTLLAAYSDFGRGMALFWMGCTLATAAEAYWIYALVHGRFDEARTYMGAMLTILITATIGYGGAFLFYSYATSVSPFSDPLLALLLPRHAVAVFFMTSIIYSTLRILFAAARAVAAYMVSHSRHARMAALAHAGAGEKGEKEKRKSSGAS